MAGSAGSRRHGRRAAGFANNLGWLLASSRSFFPPAPVPRRTPPFTAVEECSCGAYSFSWWRCSLKSPLRAGAVHGFDRCHRHREPVLYRCGREAPEARSGGRRPVPRVLPLVDQLPDPAFPALDRSRAAADRVGGVRVPLRRRRGLDRRLRSPSSVLASSIVLGVAFLAFPLSIGIAVLRFHLYDLDVIVKKTVVYAALAAVRHGGVPRAGRGARGDVRPQRGRHNRGHR